MRLVCSDGFETVAMSVADVADLIGGREFRDVTWRQGTRRALASRFAAVRVRVAHHGGPESEEQWLVIERPDPSKPPTHHVLTTLPKSLGRKELVRRIKRRWRIARTYEDMKGELGLDHFEGRSYPGWQHHITCVLSCYAFAVGERARRFPPSLAGSEACNAISRAA